MIRQLGNERTLSQSDENVIINMDDQILNSVVNDHVSIVSLFSLFLRFVCIRPQIKFCGLALKVAD